MPIEIDLEEITHALYVINRNLKTITAPDRRRYLYNLKKNVLLKLVSEGKAKKVGIHFSPNPRLSKQANDVLIEVGDYAFHIPPTKEDFQTLPHLGQREQEKRNPKVYYPFKKAIRLLEDYLEDKVQIKKI